MEARLLCVKLDCAEGADCREKQKHAPHRCAAHRIALCTMVV
jgi:hypothetical protein